MLDVYAAHAVQKPHHRRRAERGPEPPAWLGGFHLSSQQPNQGGFDAIMSLPLRGGDTREVALARAPARCAA